MLLHLIQHVSAYLPFFLSRSPCCLVIKVHWYIITVHIYLKSHLSEWEASPPLLSLCIIKCYYLHPVQLLSHPLIKSTALRKLMTPYANWKKKKIKETEKHKLATKAVFQCARLHIIRTVCRQECVITSSFSIPTTHKCTVNALCLNQWQYSRKLQVHFIS